ncbi:cytochrome P450 4F2-like [Lineus longissimus]|uniref:cytochrome P450 4F2-like n=1 Tax=Lineus longissimus TaxID=88925 RepID=UPI002B4C31BF
MNQIFNALTIIGLVYVLVKFLRWYFGKARRIIQLTSDIQAPSRNWFWGSLHQHPGLSEKTLTWYEDLSKKYGDIYKIWFGPFLPQIHIASPELAKVILRTAEPKPLDIPGYGVVQPWIGTGLLLSDGDLWHRNRHLLTPAFHFDMLKTYSDVFSRSTESLISVFDSLEERGDSFDIFKPMGLMTLDTVLQCVCSFYGDIQHLGENHRIVKLTHDALTLAIQRGLTPYLWPDMIFYMTPTGMRFKTACRQFQAFNRDIIQRRRVELDENPDFKERHRDFLDLLLVARDEDGQGLKDEEIEAEVNTFMFAGHDTTSSTLSWALYALAEHQDFQETCRREIREILKDRDSDEIQFDDLPKLTHVIMGIKETLRYFGTVPMISRKLTRDIQVGDHLLPSGVDVNIMLFLIHRHPSVWEKPDEFIPERFSADNAVNRDPFAFVPFSAGPRNCIGQNFAMNLMKVTLARILNRYIVTYDATHPIVKVPEAVLRTKSGLWLKLERT